MVPLEPEVAPQKPPAPEPKVPKIKPEPKVPNVEPAKKTPESPKPRGKVVNALHYYSSTGKTLCYTCLSCCFASCCDLRV